MYACSVNLVTSNPASSKCPDPITFTGKDMEGVNFPHSDALIIKANIEGAEVGRILIDNRGSCDILYLDVFMKMKIKPSSLKPCAGGLVSFTEHEAPIMGMVTPPMTIGEWPKATTEMVNFMIMDLPSTYNAIVGRVFDIRQNSF